MGKCQQTIEKTDGAHMPGTVIHYIRLLIKDSNQLWGKNPAENTHQFCKNRGGQNTNQHALFDTVILVGTEILTNEGREGLGKTGDRQEGKALNFGIGAAACHGSLAEAVDIGLHHQIGNGDDRVLNTGGQAVGDDLT